MIPYMLSTYLSPIDAERLNSEGDGREEEEIGLQNSLRLVLNVLTILGRCVRRPCSFLTVHTLFHDVVDGATAEMSVPWARKACNAAIPQVHSWERLKFNEFGRLYLIDRTPFMKFRRDNF